MRHERGAVLLVLAVAAWVWPAAARGQISPGPLSAAHASLGGPLQCASCHAGGKASMTSRCLSCHREIQSLVDRDRGVHARTGKAECASCHPDHAGRDFALIKWPDGSARRFDHARAGWRLEGKHAGLACEKCHTDSLRVSAVAALAPKPRTHSGWTGLETACASCHADVHRAELGRACETCHTATGWSPAPGFDHAKTHYSLTGKHADVACAKCHADAGRAANAPARPLQFKPVAHDDCVACHRDPHQGRLSGACSSCHATTSFASVEGRTFSHDRTRYPLRGRHATVGCVGCHTGYPSRIDRPQFATCAGCHGDPHERRGLLRGSAVDCASCHTVAGFTPSTFTLAQHGQSERCATCHADAHGAQLAASPGGAECRTCHTPRAWKPSTFSVQAHASTPFSLTGRHAAISCGSCHARDRRNLPALPATRTLGSANVALVLAQTTCDGCHRDPHGGRYKNAGQPQGTCATCHDTRAFRPSTIDAAAHSRFSFALEGAHRAAPCVACHTTMNHAPVGSSLLLAPAGPTLGFTLPGATCTTCHGTPHGDQFASRSDRGACESCHDLTGWMPATRFVHDANGGFTLGAAHAKVACVRCHTNATGASGAAASNAARTWRGVPRNCEACHRNGGAPR